MGRVGRGGNHWPSKRAWLNEETGTFTMLVWVGR